MLNQPGGLLSDHRRCFDCRRICREGVSVITKILDFAG
jgi:hypothetical protein